MNVLAYFSYLTLKIISKEMFLTGEGKVQKLQKKKPPGQFSLIIVGHHFLTTLYKATRPWSL